MKRLQLTEKAAIGVSWIFSVLFVVFIVIVQWPNWWMWVVFELTPMTWLESTILYTCAMIAFGCFILSFLYKENNKAKLWALLSFAFFYLSFDERFAIHERIRDKILAPNNIRIPFLFWIAPGDFILLIFLVIGIFIVPQVLGLFKVRKLAYYCFLIGVGLSAAVVIVDSIEVKQMSVEFQRLEQFVEEIVETIAMLLFMNSFFLMFTHAIESRFDWEGKD